jgi:ribosome biogenesis SPOUT family RNA methylase Rps3
MEAQNLGKYVIPIEHLHEKDDWMLSLYEEIMENLGELQTFFSNLSEQLRKEASNGIVQLLEEV